jgi:hypothetical protein
LVANIELFGDAARVECPCKNPLLDRKPPRLSVQPPMNVGVPLYVEAWKGYGHAEFSSI